MTKLDPSKINSWTIEQCIKVFANMEYVGMGDWECELCTDYLDNEEIETLNWKLASAYVMEKLRAEQKTGKKSKYAL